MKKMLLDGLLRAAARRFGREVFGRHRSWNNTVGAFVGGLSGPRLSGLVVETLCLRMNEEPVELAVLGRA
jgi:hypothetical protein